MAEVRHEIDALRATLATALAKADELELSVVAAFVAAAFESMPLVSPLTVR